MNTIRASSSPVPAKLGTVVLDSSEVQAMRHRLHELANVFTGVMIASGLLSQFLKGNALRQYAADICDSSERGCTLLRELRSQLLEACGEREAAKGGSVPGSGSPKI
jgi:nitrogen-specific signal transduction histidine kinase